MIKVSNIVTVYEVDGKETTGIPMPTISVLSHWNRDSMVVLELAGQRVTVSAQDIRAAIDNATNVSRH